MEKKVFVNTETQETISLISLVVPLDILCYCIGLNLIFHGHSEKALTPHQNLHLFLPFEVVEWSQDDMVILIHFFCNYALRWNKCAPYERDDRSHNRNKRGEKLS